MTQRQHVAFIQGLLKLKAGLTQLPHHELFAVVDTCTQAVHGIRATREHLFLALKKQKTNAPKRRWDSKQRWLVATFLVQPNLSLSAAVRQARVLFNERTRLSVAESARQRALALSGTSAGAALVADVQKMLATKLTESALA